MNPEQTNELNTISGDNGKREPPVPIPNTEVKPLRADGTWLATARESRSSPDSKEPVMKVAGSNFMYLSPNSKRKRRQRNSVERKEPVIRVTGLNFIDSFASSIKCDYVRDLF